MSPGNHRSPGRHFHEPADNGTTCRICGRPWAGILREREYHRRGTLPAVLERQRRIAAWRVMRGARRPGIGEFEDPVDVAEASLVLAIQHAATIGTVGVMACQSDGDDLAWRIRAGLLQLVADAISADFRTGRSEYSRAALNRLIARNPEEEPANGD